MDETQNTQGTPITDEQVSAICRPPALRFSKEIIEFANKKFGEAAPFWAPLVSAFTSQNILIMSLLESFEPGSEEGLKAINTFFDRCKFEVTAHWRSEHLKNQFAPKKKPSLIVAP